MLSVILGLFSSSGFGSITGLVGGYFNRKLDLEAKKIDVADHAAQRTHDLSKMDKEREFMTAEYAQRVQIADKENEGRQITADAGVEVAGYGAMAESYKFAAPTSADGWVDKASKIVRPILTLAFALFSGLIFFMVHKMVTGGNIGMSEAEIIALYATIVEWILFQAGVILGWWFAMRPGKHPKVHK